MGYIFQSSEADTGESQPPCPQQVAGARGWESIFLFLSLPHGKYGEQGHRVASYSSLTHSDDLTCSSANRVSSTTLPRRRTGPTFLSAADGIKKGQLPCLSQMVRGKG